MVFKYLREHEKSVSIVITLIGGLILSIVGIIIYSFFTNFMGSSKFTDGEKYIIIFLFAIVIIFVLSIIFIFIELKEMKKDIMESITQINQQKKGESTDNKTNMDVQ